MVLSACLQKVSQCDWRWCDDDGDVPSEFSMMRGTLPSMTATAELVVPRSIPMTAPLTFSFEPSAYPRLNVELKGDLMAG